MDTSVVDDIGQDLMKTAKIGIVILILLALILTGLNCLLIWYKWGRMKAHLENTRQAWLTDPTMYHTTTSTGMPQMTLTDHNLLMLQADSSHPLITRIANRLSQLLRLTPAQHTNLQWFFHYIFHPPAVAIFLIGFFGLLSVELQLLAMGPLVHKFQGRAAATVSDFSNTIATSINNSMYNQSATYANEVNARVDAVQTTINDGVFGWVNQTTTTLNATVNEFYNDIQNAVNTVFGGSILEQPAQEFIRCFIGGKVDAIENVLTFLHDNLKVDMPRMNDSALVLSQGTVDETVQPIAAAAIGGSADDNEGLLGKLINSYAESLKRERVMFCIFLGLWGFVVLMALAILFWHSYGRRFMENRRKKRWMNERSKGIDGVVVPYRDPSRGSAENGNSRASHLNSSVDTKINPEKILDSRLGENQPKRKVEQQRKGLIAVAKERLIPRKAPPPFIPAAEKRQTAWVGRMATILGRKGQQETTAEDRSIGKPELQSTSNEFVDLPGGPDGEPHDRIADVPKSRWSKATTQDAQTPTWSVMSPSKKSLVSPSADSSRTSIKYRSPPQPSVSLPSTGRMTISPPRPLQPRHSRNISVSPSDVDSRGSEGGFDPQAQPLLPMPLHHGFDSEHSKYPVSSNQRRHPQAPIPPSVLLHNIANTRRHRRSTSFPSVNRGSMTGLGTGGNIIPSAAGSLERLLTGSHAPHARQPSMSENPFISPFDDEHRVKIDKPAATRKSIPTNPFEGVAL
jgi:hypothetical protein